MYELTQEERMILSMVDDLCVDVVAERAAAIDEEDEFPQDIYELFVEQGLFALAYGEEHGGVEVSMHCWVQVIERIARESPAVALMILISAIGSDALVFSGSAEQQRAILPALAAGEAKICFALTEPNAGSDISAISTTALPDGDGYTINGGKIFITNGAVGDWFTVFARVVEDGQSKPSCFIVHRDTPGLVIGRKEDKMGLRGSVTSQLYFENMHVGPEAVVGEVGDGFAIAHHTLNRGRLAVAGPATRGAAAPQAAAPPRLCEGAHPVRKAYRGLAGHPLHAGRYGDHAGSVPLAVGPGGIGVRRRHPDDDEDGVGGEGVLLGGGGESG